MNSVKPVLWPAHLVTYEAPDKTGGDVPEWDVYKAGEPATVSGNTGGLTRNGYTFSGWKSSDGGATYTGGQTFPMPAKDVILTAQWTSSGGSSGGGGGGGSDDGDGGSGGVTVEPSRPTEQDPNPPTVGVLTPRATVDKDGSVKVNVGDRDIQNTIDKAVRQAKKDGT